MSSRCPVCDRRVTVDKDGEPCSVRCMIEHDSDQTIEDLETLIALLRDWRNWNHQNAIIPEETREATDALLERMP